MSQSEQVTQAQLLDAARQYLGIFSETIRSFYQEETYLDYSKISQSVCTYLDRNPEAFDEYKLNLIMGEFFKTLSCGHLEQESPLDENEQSFCQQLIESYQQKKKVLAATAESYALNSTALGPVGVLSTLSMLGEINQVFFKKSPISTHLNGFDSEAVSQAVIWNQLQKSALLKSLMPKENSESVPFTQSMYEQYLKVVNLDDEALIECLSPQPRIRFKQPSPALFQKSREEVLSIKPVPQENTGFWLSGALAFLALALGGVYAVKRMGGPGHA